MTALPPSQQLSTRELAYELKHLVSWGAKETRLLERDKVLNLPNVRLRAGEDPHSGHQPSKLDCALAAHALIVDGVNSFDRDLPGVARAYRLLLMLSDEGRKLATADERRRRAIALLDRRLEAVTWRTGPYEVDFLEELAQKILALPPEGLADPPPLPPMFEQRERAIALPDIPPAELENEVGEAIKIEYGPDPRENYTTLSIKLLCVFESGRIPARESLERVVRANNDNLRLWWEGVNYSVSNEVVQLRPLHQTARVRRKLPGNFHGFTYYELEFPRTLNKGDIHTVRVEKVITDRNSEPAPYFVYIARRSRRAAAVRVEFAPDSIPTRVFRIVTPTHRLPEVTIAERPYPMDEDGASVESPFSDLQEGVSYGFRWTWS
jgi:hypothetical protein